MRQFKLPMKTALSALAATLIASGPAPAAQAANQGDVYASIVDAKAAYSADLVLSSSKKSYQGRIVHRPGATRTELGGTITIHDHKTEKWTRVLPNHKHYLILSARGQAWAIYMPPGLKRSDLRVQTVGSETVAGEKTHKLKVSFPTGVLTLWQTGDGIVVKMNGTVTVRKQKRTVTFVLKNLKRGAQDPALFLPPPGSEPLNGPGRKNTGPRKSRTSKKK
jgi:hypothetical protein